MPSISGDQSRIRTGRMWPWCKMTRPPRRWSWNHSRIPLAGAAAAGGGPRGGAALGGVVDRDGLEQVAGDLFAAVFDGQDRRAADQLGQAADHAAAAAVEVVLQHGQAARLVLVQPQRGVHGGDQRAPLLPLGAGAVGERGGRDDGEPAGDLPAPGAGEQPGGLHVDARVVLLTELPELFFQFR